MTGLMKSLLSPQIHRAIQSLEYCKASGDDIAENNKSMLPSANLQSSKDIIMWLITFQSL